MIIIDFKDLTIIINISETKSISETSRNLYLSQPAITYRLRNLEQELGIRILNRHSDGVTFTNQGMRLLEYSKNTMKSYEELKTEIKKINNDVNGSITIFVSTVYAKYYLAHMLKKFNTEFPNIDISLKTFSSCDLNPDLISYGAADIVIRRGDVPYDGRKIILGEEPYGIVSRIPLNFKDLINMTWIKYDLPSPMEPDMIFWNWCENTLKQTVFEKIIQVNSIEACMNLVSQGLGWTMLPKIHLNNYKSMLFYPLTDENGNVVKLKNILLGDDNTDNLACKIFVGFITDYISKH
ncbi:MAG: LysR family transcriptional regulator [Sedimentibacter sp.]|uniref:LysR family transcriptional regulator n=1 Tax=Sedimentibacter sp. TaxID=1960295 RepID=UPI0031582EB9